MKLNVLSQTVIHVLTENNNIVVTLNERVTVTVFCSIITFYIIQLVFERCLGLSIMYVYGIWTS